MLLNTLLGAALAAGALASSHDAISHAKRMAHAKRTVPTITGATGPVPTAPLTRSGGQLKLGSANFYATGANVYWLGLDENDPAGTIAYPSQDRVNEAMAIIKAMGGTMVRVGLANTVGCAKCIEPTRGKFNSEAFDAMDYAIYAAGQYGLRVVGIMTDVYNYYAGGVPTYLGWRAQSQNNQLREFFTNSQVKGDFKNHIKNVLRHKNKYNGKRYGADPTIAILETGNEFGGYILRNGTPPAAWTNEIAGYLKSLAPNKLIMDGTYGLYTSTCDGCSSGSVIPGANIDTVDLLSYHGYYANDGIYSRNRQIALDAGKVNFLGEYNWKSTNGGQSDAQIDTIFSTRTNNLVWSIFGHDISTSSSGKTTCNGYVQHNDGYSLYYPDGNSAADRARILRIVQRNYKLQGLSVPSSLPQVKCPQPKLPKQDK